VTAALGYSQGGFSAKVQVRVEGQGRLMTIVLTPGQRHEAMAFVLLIEAGTMRQLGSALFPHP
jgi:hypothetical protein